MTTDVKFKCNDLLATSLSLLPCDMVLHHAGKCSDHKIANESLGELALKGCFDAILYSWKCFWAELWHAHLFSPFITISLLL